VSTTQPVGRRYTWRVRGCHCGSVCSPWSPVRYVNVGRLGDDLNGDGFSDAIVVAPSNDAGGVDFGRTYVFLGGMSTDATADAWFTSTSVEGIGGEFGGVNAVGDVNGDGFADFAVGAFSNDAAGADAGRAYFFLGAATLSGELTPSRTYTGAAPGDTFGSAVASAGDLNGDGFRDLVIGAPNNDTAGSNAGRAYVYLGAPGGPDAAAWKTFDGPSGSTHGIGVASAGDVNNDGFADLLVGAHSGAGTAGRGMVYLGGSSMDTTADVTFVNSSGNDRLGISVSSAGDMNSDGFADVVLGAGLALGSDNGRLYAYLGGAPMDASPDLTATGQAFDLLGWSVAGGFDFNGDGFSDVAAGAWQADPPSGNDAGAAYIFLGGNAPLDRGVDLSLAGEAGGDHFGAGIGVLQDMNGDGFADLLVGAGDNATGGASTGRAYVFFGGSALDAMADLTLTGAAAGDNFGRCVSGR
jgi:hypothetical protein